MKDLIAKGIAIFLSVALLGYIVLSFLQAEARVVNVRVISETETVMRVVADKIPDNTPIDIQAVFSETERSQAKEGLGLSQREGEVLDTVLTGEDLDINDAEAYVSVLNQLLNESPISEEESKHLLGITKSFSSHDVVRYLVRKRIQEL